MRFQFIEDHQDEFPVSRMCKVLDVLRSSYYAWRGRPPSEREMANQELYKKVKAVYDENHRTYGSPRIYYALQDKVPCSENRVARLRRRHSLQARQTKSYRTTTKRNRADPVRRMC
jgi:putative transposase